MGNTIKWHRSNKQPNNYQIIPIQIKHQYLLFTQINQLYFDILIINNK